MMIRRLCAEPRYSSVAPFPALLAPATPALSPFLYADVCQQRRRLEGGGDAYERAMNNKDVWLAPGNPASSSSSSLPSLSLEHDLAMTAEFYPGAETFLQRFLIDIAPRSDILDCQPQRFEERDLLFCPPSSNLSR